jgi:hypothetical protein
MSRNLLCQSAVEIYWSFLQYIFQILICAFEMCIIHAIFCSGLIPTNVFCDELFALTGLTYFVRWSQLEIVEDGKIDVVNNDSDNNGRHIDQPIKCSMVVYFRWNPHQCNSRKMAAREHVLFLHVAALWRMEINLIHFLKGQRRDRDKGMKGIKEM